MSYGISHGPAQWTDLGVPRPDSMTPEDHAAFLAELAAKYPAPEGMTGYSDCKTKKDKIAFLRHKLATDLYWASKGVVQILKLQTGSEKASGATTDSNGVGFSGFDARGLTYIANWINTGIDRYNKTFGNAVDQPKSIRKLHKIMPKYAEQLRRIADGELTVPA